MDSQDIIKINQIPFNNFEFLQPKINLEISVNISDPSNKSFTFTNTNDDDSIDQMSGWSTPSKSDFSLQKSSTFQTNNVKSIFANQEENFLKTIKTEAQKTLKKSKTRFNLEDLKKIDISLNSSTTNLFESHYTTNQSKH